MSDIYNKGNGFFVNVLEKKEVFYLDCFIEPRYFEDSKINGEQDDEIHPKMPCYNPNTNDWRILINLHSGQIQNWVEGNYADIHYKVCDQGTYHLLDENYNIVAKIENGYVPEILCVGENGFGDYVIMHIDENGFIRDFKVELEEFNYD